MRAWHDGGGGGGRAGHQRGRRRQRAATGTQRTGRPGAPQTGEAAQDMPVEAYLDAWTRAMSIALIGLDAPGYRHDHAAMAPHIHRRDAVERFIVSVWPRYDGFAPWPWSPTGSGGGPLCLSPQRHGIPAAFQSTSWRAAGRSARLSFMSRRWVRACLRPSVCRDS